MNAASFDDCKTVLRADLTTILVGFLFFSLMHILQKGCLCFWYCYHMQMSMLFPRCRFHIYRLNTAWKNHMLITFWGCSRISHLNMFCFAGNSTNSRSMYLVAWSLVTNISRFRKSFLIITITNNLPLTQCLDFYPTLCICLFVFNNLYFSEDNQYQSKGGWGNGYGSQPNKQIIRDPPAEEISEKCFERNRTPCSWLSYL